MEREKKESNTKLRQLQLQELEILNEFVRICDKFRLKYYLIGGTLLGAVRHGGFIPWDDDIDVGMLREDYERFAEICRTELGSQYFYQSPETDPCYFLSYAKIRKNNTEVYEERFKDSKFHKGIFIDIFPLDFCPKPGICCHFLFNVLAVMNYRGQVDSGEKYRPYEELIGKLGYTVLQSLSPDGLLRLRKFLILLGSKLSCGRYIANYAGAYGYYKEVSPWEWFANQMFIRFEGIDHPAPIGADKLMSRSYGAEYLSLPPESERRSHLEIDKIL